MSHTSIAGVFRTPSAFHDGEPQYGELHLGGRFEKVGHDFSAKVRSGVRSYLLVLPILSILMQTRGRADVDEVRISCWKQGPLNPNLLAW